MSEKGKTIALALAVATWLCGAGHAAPFEMSGTLEGTLSIERELEPEPGAEHVRVVVEASCKRGRVWTRLQDPSGKTVVEGECTSGRLTVDSGELEPREGVWRFVFESTREKVRFEIRATGLREVE